MKLLKKWLRVSGRKQTDTEIPRRTVGQSVKHSWDCSQIENEVEEGRGSLAKKENQMEMQWAEDEKLEELLEQRRMERCSLQAEVTQKTPELVVRARMSQSKGVKTAKEKKKVKGWSSQEETGKSNRSSKEDTEEMKNWRDMKYEEIDQCWRDLAGRMEEEVLHKYKVEDSKREVYRGRDSHGGKKRVRKSKKYNIKKWWEDCWTRVFSLFREYNRQCLQSKQEESTEGEEMK